MKHTAHTSLEPKGDCRGFPHTSDKLSNCHKRNKIKKKDIINHTKVKRGKSTTKFADMSNIQTKHNHARQICHYHYDNQIIQVCYIKADRQMPPGNMWTTQLKLDKF